MKIKLSITLMVALLLIGCAPQPSVSLPSGKSETITIKANFTDEISKEPVILSDVKRAIVKTILEASKYKKVTSEKFTIACDWHEGLDIKFKENSLEIFYVNGKACEPDKDDVENSEYLTYFGAKIPYKITGTQDKFEMSFSYPKEFIQRTYKYLGFAEVLHLDVPSNLMRDFDNLFQSLRNLSITREYTFKGEEDSKYNKDSTIDSLKNANLSNKSQTIEYDVFNYKNGSKVTYKAIVNYTIDRNNEVDIGKDIVSRIKRQIKKTID